MTLCCSYVPDYFSINDILATEERLTCVFEVTIPGLGFLDAATDSEDLKEGTKLELPIWLAHPLNAIQRSIVSVEIPKIYNENYREILQADASAVSLNTWSPFYYESGMHFTQFKNRECEKIAGSLLQTFKSRFRLVMDWAQNPVLNLAISGQLPRLERDLFLSSRSAKIKLNEWLKKGTGIIETSVMAANLKKRKRTDYELN